MNRTPGFELEKPTGETKTPEQLAAEKAEADKAAAGKAAADAAAAGKTPEQIEAEKKAADEKAAADLAAKGEPNPLDALGPLPVETLAKAINDHPELATALEAAGIDPELMYETSRQAAMGQQFAEIFPTIEAAKFGAESAENFYKLEEGFPKVNTIDDLDKFISGTMLPLSVLYDAEGKPLTNADGSYQTDGSIARFFSATSQMETVMGVRAIEGLLAEAEKVGGEAGEAMKEQAERIKDALIMAQEFRDNGYKIPGKKAAPAARSPEDQKAIEEANRIRQEAAKTKEEADAKAVETFDTSVTNDVIASNKSFIAGILGRTALSDFDKTKVAAAALEGAWNVLGKNIHFQQTKAHLQNLGPTDANRKQLVAMANRAFEREALTILRKEIAAAGGKLMTKQQQTQTKQEKQIANDRMNQAGGTTPGAKGPAVKSAAEVRTQAISNLKAAGNAYPDDGEILAESVRIRNVTRAA